MRSKVTSARLQAFMSELAKRSKGPGSVFFTGGATALLLGLREQTIDVDIRLDPEPPGAFQAISELKNLLDLNVELASPADFLPVTADWKSRSLHIARAGELDFFHFDLRAQVLSKIERGYAQDIADARQFMRIGEITPAELRSYFAAIEPMLLRYPAIDARRMRAKVESFLKEP